MNKTFNFNDIKDIIHQNNCIIIGNLDSNEIKFDNIASKTFRNEFSLDWFKGKLSDLTFLFNLPSKLILVDKVNISKFSSINIENKLFIFCENVLEVVFEIAHRLYKNIDIISLENRSYDIANSLTNNTFIDRSCVVGSAQIGKNCKIYANCFIGNDVIIKNGVIIYPGCTIGSDGFGFYITKEKKRKRYKHIGRVIIEDNVEVGSNTCIDKGVFSDTIIGKETKIDSLVHIGHNVSIGENVFIGSNSTICGSVMIGNNVWISPNSVIKEHVIIEDDVFIGLGSVVVENVKKGKSIVGNFAIDKEKFLLDYFKKKSNLK